MGFNYALEKKKFDQEWNRLRKEYEDAGMSSKVIQELYEYDWADFKSNRIYAMHTQPIPVAFTEEGGHDFESKSPLLEKFFSAMSVNDNYTNVSRYAWIDEIEDESISKKLRQLAPTDLELLTMIVVLGFDQAEIARIQNCSRNTICKKIKRIKKILP